MLLIWTRYQKKWRCLLQIPATLTAQQSYRKQGTKRNDDGNTIQEVEAQRVKNLVPCIFEFNQTSSCFPTFLWCTKLFLHFYCSFSQQNYQCLNSLKRASLWILKKWNYWKAWASTTCWIYLVIWCQNNWSHGSQIILMFSQTHSISPWIFHTIALAYSPSPRHSSWGLTTAQSLQWRCEESSCRNQMFQEPPNH